MLYQFLLYLKKLGISKRGITKKLKYNEKNGGITKKKTNGGGGELQPQKPLKPLRPLEVKKPPSSEYLGEV